MTLKAIALAPPYKNPIEADRTLVDTLAGRVAGVIFETLAATQSAALEFKVSPTAGQHSATVATGKALVREKTNPNIRGGYYVHNDGNEVVPLPVPQANPFIATVILRVADQQYGAVTGTVGPRIDVVSGATHATAPVAPSDATINAVVNTPGGWTRLCDVRINTADTGAIPAGQFTDKRSPGGFDVINCWSTNRPVVSGPGTGIFEMDTKASGTWDGAAWTIQDSIWQAYTPTHTVGGVATTIGNGTNTGKSFRQGKNISFKVKFILGSTTSFGGVGVIEFGLPYPSVPAVAIDDQYVVGGALGRDASPGALRNHSVRMSNTSKVVVVDDADAAWTGTVPWQWAAGDFQLLQGQYEGA